MGTKTFNIEDSLYDNFSKAHKGDMSKILSELIENYLNIKKENLDLTKLKENLIEIQKQTEKLKQDESNIKLFIRQLEEEYKKEVVKAKDEHLEIRKWARDIMHDAKKSGQYTELTYQSEKKGFNDVEEYLVQKWLTEAKNDR